MRTKPGLYVHIPFCEIICPFCPYNKMAYERSLCGEYADALIREIKLVGEKVAPRTVSSLYFGGGSPILLGDKLSEVLRAINEIFDITGEIAIEVSVADLNELSIEYLLDIGVTMVSIGVQSFCKKSSDNLGRGFVPDAEDRVKTAAAAGFDTVDVDLIFGIPGQTPDDLVRDFSTAAECGATQISTYPFIDFSYADNAKKPLGRRSKREMLSALTDAGERCGFERSSVWSFVRIGTEKYSSITREAFIGFGSSAVSLFTDIFTVNTFSIYEYIRTVNNDEIPTALALRFGERTASGYWLFWRLYTMDIDGNRFRELFGEKIESMFGWELKLALAAGLLVVSNGRYQLTERGAYYYHLIEQEYTHKYIDKLWSALRETAWPENVKIY